MLSCAADRFYRGMKETLQTNGLATAIAGAADGAVGGGAPNGGSASGAAGNVPKPD